jgi:hypothetical protein
MDRPLFEPYRKGLAEGGHPPTAGRMAGTVNVVLADDPEATWPRIKPHLAYQFNSYQRYAVEGTGHAAPAAVDPEQLRASEVDHRIARRFDVVTVDQAEALVRETVAGLPVTDIFFWASIAGMDDDLVGRNIELIARELRPRLLDV